MSYIKIYGKTIPKTKQEAIPKKPKKPNAQPQYGAPLPANTQSPAPSAPVAHEMQRDPAP